MLHQTRRPDLHTGHGGELKISKNIWAETVGKSREIHEALQTVVKSEKTV
ncbi:MAG: hypothetical protein Kow0059_17770 [Candidatus Sumerlaeia bacterium]